MGKILTRMGDGALIEISESELRADIESGTRDAAERGRIDPLTAEEIDYLFEIYSAPQSPGHVEAGKFVLGMHGDLQFDGMRLAGLYLHEQIKLAQKAGVTIFGQIVNTTTTDTCEPCRGFSRPSSTTC